MPKYDDGLITNSGLTISALSAGVFSSLTSSGSFSASTITPSILNVNQQSTFGIQTFNSTVNTTYGSGALAAFGMPSITLTNGGALADLSLVSLKGGTISGNPSQTITDVSTLHIAAPTSISGATTTGSSWSLKVSSGNSCFGGNIIATGSITCSSVTASTGTFSGGLSFTAPVNITNTTQSTSTTTGSLTTTGGVGIAKDLFVGGNINCLSLSTGTLSLSTLALTTLSVSSTTTVSDLSMSGGLLRLSTRSAITSGSPYVINFSAAEKNVIIPVNSAGAFSMTVPSGLDGQLLIIMNIGAGTLNLTISADFQAGTFPVPSGGKLFFVWYSSTWISIA